MEKESVLNKDMELFLKSVFKDKQYEIFPLTEEGSDRRYVRIETDDSSWVLACSSGEQQERFLLKQREFSRMGLNVPKWKAHKKGFLLLEDLGDQSLEKEVLEKRNFPLAYYFQALDQIIKLQNPQNNSRRSLNWSSFKKENFFKEMLWTEEHLIKYFLHLNLDEKLRKQYLKEWDFLCEKLVCSHFLLAHRDYHSRNLFIKDEKLYLIDFQDAGLFPRFYDSVSLIYDVYAGVKMDNKMREKMLNYFLLKNSFPEKKITDEIREEISLTLMQRLFKACGSFAGFYSLKGQKTHLRYIRPALEMLRKEFWKIRQYPYFFSLVDLCLEKLKKKDH